MSDRKLLLTKYQNYDAAFLLEHNRLTQVMLSGNSPYSIGDVYVGRVKNIVKGMNAAFVEFSKGNVGFLPLSHFSPDTVLNRQNAETIKCGDHILVQICKEPVKTKDATLTTDISFPGHYMVLTPFCSGIHYSKKFSSEEKEHVRALLTQVFSDLSETSDDRNSRYGLVVRTKAGTATCEELYKEFHKLTQKAKQLLSIADKRTVFSCLYKEKTFFDRIIDTYKAEDIEIITDLCELIEQKPASDCAVRFYEDDRLSLQSLYGLNEKIDEALEKKVWLKSGGYLIVEPTETLTVIDVNSGKTSKSTGKLSFDEFHHRVNLEAAVEIMRQIRLRNISGMILIDFLKTHVSFHEELLNRLRILAQNDPIETVVVDMTGLGLVELTRKKTEAPLYEKLKKGNPLHET